VKSNTLSDVPYSLICATSTTVSLAGLATSSRQQSEPSSAILKEREPDTVLDGGY
jgi:hypothetical protein